MRTKSESQPVSLPKEFVPIEDAADIVAFLKEAAIHFCEASFWTKNREVFYKTKFLDFDLDNQKFTLFTPPDFDFKKLKTCFETTGEQDCYFNLFLSKASLLFLAPFFQFDDMGIHFRAPRSVFRLQRRKDMRVMIPPKFTLRVELPDPLERGTEFKARLLDISEGGLSFVVSEADSILFPVGYTIQELKFSLLVNMRSLPVIAQGVVRHSRILPHDSQISGVKIGVQFSQINTSSIDNIRSYVLEESQKIFLKGNKYE